MKRNKLGLSILVLGAAGFLACLPSGEVGYVPSELLLQNTEFLVALPGTKLNKNNAEIKGVQNNFFAKLNNLIGKDNYTVKETFDAINVVKIQANEAYENLIGSIDIVTSVAKNESYRFSDLGREQTEAEKKEGYIPLADTAEDATGSEETDNTNISAETMHVPSKDETGGGAGSFIAILDSSFYLEHHYFANYDPTEDAVARQMADARFNYEDLRALYSNPDLIATHAKEYGEEADAIDFQSTEPGDGSLYWNLKIPFYYDYGASSQNSNNDYDVLSYWSEHGNHVASIAGANGTYDGIAPNAQLALMKVFYESIPTDDTTPGGVYATDEDVVEALNDCVLLDVDALNMSLGSDLDDFRTESVAMVKLNELEAAGIDCNISAGNGGKTMFSSMGVYKNWSTDLVDTGVLGSYAVNTNANVIASNTTPIQYYETGLKIKGAGENGTDLVVGYDDQVDYTDGSDGITEGKERLLAGIYDQFGIAPNELQLVTAGKADSSGNYYGTDADYSTVVSATGDNTFFKNKVVVVDRGSNSFVEKASAAEDQGAAGLIVINNDPTAFEFNFGMSWMEGETASIPGIPVVFVLYQDRDTILDALSEEVKNDKGEIVAHQSSAGNIEIIEDEPADNPNKDQISDFSSEGATSNLDIIPTITAPGTSIRGAILGEAGSQGNVTESTLDPDAVGYMNGTSMAAPNYTGVSALMVGMKQKEYWDEHPGELMPKEERQEYLKTISMRTMSTADQYQYGNAEVIDITPEDAVTDDDYKTPVTIYKPTYKDGLDGEGNPVETMSDYSPRKQGAGIVNVGDAMKTEVYLEGLVPDEETGEYGPTYTGNGFAKIELRNNAKIAKGDISLGVRLHNEGSEAKTYNAKITVMAPFLNKYHNHDNEMPNYVAKDSIYEGATLQTAYDTTLETIELGEVTVNGNSTVDKVFDTKTVSQATKDYLDIDRFPNGTYIEGYLTLEETSSTNNNITLTAPYMGFYGDYAQADATEPFEFEKEERYNIEEGKTDGMLYGSDLVNYIGQNSYSRSYINTSSMIVGDSYDNYQMFNRRAGIQVNSTNPAAFGKELTYKKDDNGDITLYVGSDTTDVLYIQEFVYRSIESEQIELLDETGAVVSSNYMSDIITNTRNLYKSHVGASYISDYSLVHRGLSELPLYNEDGAKLPDGNYSIRFTYNLVYGSTQVKEFNLVIDSKAPALVSKSIITDASGNKKLRLKFNELYIPSEQQVHINADLVSFTLTKVSDGYLVDIPLNEVTDGKIYVNIGDSTFNTSYYVINESDYANGLMIESDALTPFTTYTYTKTSTAKGNINDKYVINFKDAVGEDTTIGEYTVYLTYSKKINSVAKVFVYNENGVKSSISYERIDDTTIKFTTSATEFSIEDNGKVNSNVSFADNATVSFTSEQEGGTVYVDKVSGLAGEVATIYAIAKDGYKVTSVTVNGEVIALDQYGNYQFVLESGVNQVVVTFEKVAE